MVTVMVTNVLYSPKSLKKLMTSHRFLRLSYIFPRSSRTMRILTFTSGRMHLRGRRRGVVPPCNTVLRLYALPFPAAMASGAFVFDRAFRSISIRYCRAAACARRCNRSFLALLESRRLNLAAHAALGSIRSCFTRQRYKCVLIKIGRELYVRSIRWDSTRI